MIQGIRVGWDADQPIYQTAPDFLAVLTVFSSITGLSSISFVVLSQKLIVVTLLATCLLYVHGLSR